jgi:hypothetical protein
MDQIQAIIQYSIFTFVVDCDNPLWSKYPYQGRYVLVDPYLKAGYFPIRFSGKIQVTVEIISYPKDCTLREHLGILVAKGTLSADRAITETFHEKFPEERLKGDWIFSPCGAQFKYGNEPMIASIVGHGDGIELYSCSIDEYLDHTYRLLVLRDVKPLAA